MMRRDSHPRKQLLQNGKNRARRQGRDKPARSRSDRDWRIRAAFERVAPPLLFPVTRSRPAAEIWGSREQEKSMKRTLTFLAAMVVIGLPGLTWGQSQYPTTQTSATDSSQNVTNTSSTTSTTDATADPDMPKTA